MLGMLLVGLLSPRALAQTGELGIEPSGLDELLAETQQSAVQTVSTASGYAQQVDRTPSNVFVIDRQQIEAVNPKHPAEMLRFVPGFVVLRRQQFSYEISAFGTGSHRSNKVLVLLDGHRVTSPTYGDAFWHLIPVVQDDVERIEVVLGPESTTYGSNAFAAVVNFITRGIRDGDGRLTMRTGSDSFHQVNFTSSTRNQRGGTKILLSSEHRGSVGPFRHFGSGQIDPTFFGGDRFTQGLFRVQHERTLSERTRLRFAAGLTQSTPRGAVPNQAQQMAASDSDQERLHLTLDLDHDFSPDRFLSLRASFQNDHQAFGQAPLRTFGNPETEEHARQAEFDLRYHWEPSRWKLTAGANLRSFGVASPYVSPTDSQESKSLYLQGEREYGEKFVLFLGARSIFQETADDVTSWKVAGLYRPRSDVGFRLSVGTSFREPDYVGLFFRPHTTFQAGPFQLPLTNSLTAPNPNLVSERAKGFVQFGVEKKWDRERVKLDFYRSEHEGTILARSTGAPVTAFVPPFGPTFRFGTQIQFQNLRDQEVRGVTLAYQRDLPEGFQLHLGLNIQDLDSPNYPHADAFAPPRSGSLLIHRPAKGRQLGGSLSLYAVDRYGISTQQSGPGYGMVGLNLERKVSDRATLALTVQNLLDQEHVEVAHREIGAAGVDNALFWGREAYLTVRFEL